MAIDLDALAIQVGRETLVDLEEWPVATPPRDRIMAGFRDDSLLGRTAILGARAMLAKLRELGLVVECAPASETPRDGSSDPDAGAKILADWFGYAWDGLDDRDISERYPDWTPSRSLQGGKPALRKIVRRILNEHRHD